MNNKKEHEEPLRSVRITAMRQTVYRDLMELGGERPEGLCESAWESMRPFVEALARGEGNFYDGWMQNPRSAMISCNDGFRPVSFYLETLDNSQ